MWNASCVVDRNSVVPTVFVGYEGMRADHSSAKWAEVSQH